MYAFQIDFRIHGGRRKVDQAWSGRIAEFLAALVNNGQILDLPWAPIVRPRGLRIHVHGPAPDALRPPHDDPRVRKARRTLMPPPRILYLGSDVEGSGHCRCASPGRYVLFTTYLSGLSPIQCGDCDEPVPLYTLPHLRKGGDWYEVRAWAATYRACDTLYMDSGFGEKWGIENMASTKSGLSRRGRTLCAEMERTLRKPFYYYVHPPEIHRTRRCPGCRKAWRTGSGFTRFTHACERCRLVSTVS